MALLRSPICLISITSEIKGRGFAPFNFLDRPC
nr:MAG TPA: hypothetical protein [Caudoviricetes sp.]